MISKISFTHKISIKTIAGISLLFVLMVLAGCSHLDESSISDSMDWKYDDLRLLDPVDSEDVHRDMIALYIKKDAGNINIRLDLLEMEPTDLQDIYIGLDYKPGGSSVDYFDQSARSEILWDAAIKFPSSGEIKGYDDQGEPIVGMKARILRDAVLDTISVSIGMQNLLSKGSPIKLEILIADPAINQVLDRMGPANSSSVPPLPAQIIIGFWNVFVPYTPAQALRAWDGAHAGPTSSRHGLRHILEEVERSNVKVNLFDLCSPTSISGLSFLEVYRDIRDLIIEGKLDGGCGFGVENLLFDSRDFCEVDNGYAKFAYDQIDNSLSLSIRTQIVDAAFSGEPYLIGGDFSLSSWGNPQQARESFYYLENHPWILTMTASHIEKGSIGVETCVKNKALINSIDPIVHDQFRRQYLQTADNVLKRLAWQSYWNILQPAYPEAGGLLNNYFGQLGHILAAAAWYEEPYRISACEVDLDWDGQAECLLASERFFLTFETVGGYLAFAFYKDDVNVHQITAPISQVVIGLGDPSTYDAGKGTFADPSSIPGSLASEDEMEYVYSYRTGAEFLELTHEPSGITKTFKITEDRITLKWSSEQPVEYHIPLSIDPWLRFEEDWSEHFFTQQNTDSWMFGITDDFALGIKPSSQAQFYTFLDSINFIKTPEDPNFEYPRGHYLPFPYAMLELAPAGSTSVELTILDP